MLKAITNFENELFKSEDLSLNNRKYLQRLHINGFLDKSTIESCVTYTAQEYEKICLSHLRDPLSTGRLSQIISEFDTSQI